MSMDGLSFCNAGKRAYHLIKKNLAGLVAINSVGNLVLEMAKFLILILCCFIGYKIVIVSSAFDNLFLTLLSEKFDEKCLKIQS